MSQYKTSTEMVKNRQRAGTQQVESWYSVGGDKAKVESWSDKDKELVQSRTFHSSSTKHLITVLTSATTTSSMKVSVCLFCG